MIVIDMDMPKSCATCKIMCKHKEKAGIRYSRGDFSIPNDCPIKCNIEDIKAEIEQRIEMFVSAGDFGNAVTISSILGIIDKHCGKENDV